MTATTVHVEVRNRGFDVVLTTGERIAVVGTHPVRYRATEQRDRVAAELGCTIGITR